MRMEIISFDANKNVWNEFLIKQPEEHPDFFKIPQTFQGQVYFTTFLELIAKRSMSLDTVQGLWSFINKVQSEHVRTQMWTWLNNYTPIRQKNTSSGHSQTLIIKDYRSKCSLIEGKEHPYYTLKPQLGKHLNVIGTRPMPVLEQDPVAHVLAPALSELDFQKKIIKLSLNKFLDDRTIEHRDALVKNIQAIPLGAGQSKGTPFFQGGAIGSKR
jgi:hypothetical protein